LSTTQELRAFLCACLWKIFSSIVPVCNRKNKQAGVERKHNTMAQFTNRIDKSVTSLVRLYKWSGQNGAEIRVWKTNLMQWGLQMVSNEQKLKFSDLNTVISVIFNSKKLS
jgi:hypothetical protein